jgi:hypothetical protein
VDHKTVSGRTLESEEFEEGGTRRYSRVAPLRVSEVVRPTPLFLRLATVLGLDDDAISDAVLELLASTDAVPQSLTHDQLVAVAPGLLAIIETLLPDTSRQLARDALCVLLQPTR